MGLYTVGGGLSKREPDRLTAVWMQTTNQGSANDQHAPRFAFDLQDFGGVIFKYEIKADILQGYRLKHCCRKIR